MSFLKKLLLGCGLVVVITCICVMAGVIQVHFIYAMVAGLVVVICLCVWAGFLTESDYEEDNHSLPTQVSNGEVDQLSHHQGTGYNTSGFQDVKILRYGSFPTMITYANEKLTVKGHVVKFSDFIGENGQLQLPSSCIGRVTTNKILIEVYAANKVVVDSDFDAVGLEINMVVLAPEWEVVGSDRHLNFNGASEPDRYPSRALDGVQVHSKAGTEGHAGMAGKPGGPGGVFVGIAMRITDAEKLKVTTNGGDGGAGQDGGNGGQGSQGRDSTKDDKYVEENHQTELSNWKWRKFAGHPGFSGGKGGDGGVGGLGGSPGIINILSFDKSAGTVTYSYEFGATGKFGVGGTGGLGGLPGAGMHWDQHVVQGFVRKDEFRRMPSSLPRAPNGVNGNDNHSRLGQGLPDLFSFNLNVRKSIKIFLKTFPVPFDDNEKLAEFYEALHRCASDLGALQYVPIVIDQ